jgi:hypothetical protein
MRLSTAERDAVEQAAARYAAFMLRRLDFYAPRKCN